MAICVDAEQSKRPTTVHLLKMNATVSAISLADDGAALPVQQEVVADALMPSVELSLLPALLRGSRLCEKCENMYSYF